MSLENLIAEQVRTVVAEAIAPLLSQRATLRLSYTVKEAAELTGASQYDLRRAITAGELSARKAGEGLTGKYLIPTDCLSAWLHGHQQPKPTGQRKAH